MGSQHNVIVLIFDTLRSDHLGCYGGEATPAFDSLAADGVVFESAFGTAPGTPISHASLYTGQYPSEHGVTGQYMDLPTDRPVIADHFREAGYETFGITGPAKMGSEWGYDRGFDELFEHYHDLPSPTSWRSVTKSLTDARFRRYFARKLTRGGTEKTRFKFELLRDRIEDEFAQPFCAVCNIPTVHSPYDPPRPYKRTATPEFSRPRLNLLEVLLDDPGTVADPEVRMERVMDVQTATGIGQFLADPNYLNEAEIRLLRAWYAASVSYLDDEFERFLAYYRDRLQDDTVLVVTADHGEQLGEHGLWGHSHGLYDETVKVPLVVAGPGVPDGERRRDLASHVDVFDTLCDLCGVERPGTTSGLSLFEGRERDAVFMEYGERDVDEFAENAHGRYLGPDRLRELAAGRKAVRTHDHRLEVTSDGDERLFVFPGEVELEDPPRDVTTRLHDRLLDELGDDFGVWPEGDPDDLGLQARVKDNLRDLGYVE
jgi:arylsulfatase A-like enzyme